MSNIEFERGESLGELDEYHQQRFLDAQKLLELCLATRTGENDWSNGVYAEIHGFDGKDAVLAVAPLLKYGRMFAGSSEYNHSIFDNIRLAREEYPEIHSIVTQKLGLSQSSTVHRGILSKNEDGSLRFGIIDSQRTIRKDILEALRDRFNVSKFFLNSEFMKADFEIDDLETRLEVMGRSNVEVLEDLPPVSGFEVGVTVDVRLQYEHPYPHHIKFGQFGTLAFSSFVVTSGHASHQQLLEALHAKYPHEGFDETAGETVRLQIGKQPEMQQIVTLRHTRDDVHKELKIDLQMTSVDEQDRAVLNLQSVAAIGGALLIGYAKSLLNYESENFYRSANNPQDDEYITKPTKAVVSVALTEVNTIMQNILDWESLYKLGYMSYEDVMKQLSEGWRAIGGASFLQPPA